MENTDIIKQYKKLLRILNKRHKKQDKLFLCNIISSEEYNFSAWFYVDFKIRLANINFYSESAAESMVINEDQNLTYSTLKRSREDLRFWESDDFNSRKIFINDVIKTLKSLS